MPPGWTWAKLEWATSAVVSLRGIGWNYSAPLSTSQRSRPYDRHSSRTEYIIRRSIYGLLNLLIDDACGALMRRTAADFFITGNLRYAGLMQWQRGFCSTLVVMRTVCSLEFTHVGFSIVFVLLGGLLGKDDHELLTPWGWPPMFASLKEIFSHPGLSYLWARVSVKPGRADNRRGSSITAVCCTCGAGFLSARRSLACPCPASPVSPPGFNGQKPRSCRLSRR